MNNSQFVGKLNSLHSDINPGVKLSVQIGQIYDSHAQSVYAMKYLQSKIRQRNLSFFTKLEQKSLVKADKNKKR